LMAVDPRRVRPSAGPAVSRLLLLTAPLLAALLLTAGPIVWSSRQPPAAAAARVAPSPESGSGRVIFEVVPATPTGGPTTPTAGPTGPVPSPSGLPVTGMGNDLNKLLTIGGALIAGGALLIIGLILANRRSDRGSRRHT
jgi:hypothetical protein